MRGRKTHSVALLAALTVCSGWAAAGDGEPRPVFGGRAYMAATPLGPPIGDTGWIESSGHAVGQEEIADWDFPALGPVVGSWSTVVIDPPQVEARTVLGMVRFRVGDVDLVIDSIRMTARASCASSTGELEVGSVEIDDQPVIAPGKVPPGERVDLPGGAYAVFNEQVSVAGVTSGLAASMVRVSLPGAADVVVGHALATATCP